MVTLVRMPNGWLSGWLKGECCIVYTGSTGGDVANNVILRLYGFSEQKIAKAMADTECTAWKRRMMRLPKAKREWLAEMMRGATNV